MAKIGLIGAGSWGTALSLVLTDNGHELTVWSCVEQEISMLREYHEQKDKLPGVILPDTIKYTMDLGEAINGMDMVVLAVPSPFTRNTAHNMAEYVKDGQLIVSVSKGIEEDSVMFLSDIIEEEIPNAEVAVLSGPSHAEEVGRRLPTVLVAGAKSSEVAETVQNAFMNKHLRVYTSSDRMGIQLGASVKNVIALAAGMSDGIGFGDNMKAALIIRGIYELQELAKAMGGCAETLSGLTGTGDLIVTCGSMHSRNRRAGILIGQGMSVDEAMKEVKQIVEGVYSAKGAKQLAQKYNVELPIVDAVNRILFEGLDPSKAVDELMIREKKTETPVVGWQNS